MPSLISHLVAVIPAGLRVFVAPGSIGAARMGICCTGNHASENCKNNALHIRRSFKKCALQCAERSTILSGLRTRRGAGQLAAIPPC